MYPVFLDQTLQIVSDYYAPHLCTSKNVTNWLEKKWACRLNDDKVNLEKSEFQLRPQINHAKETKDTSSESLNM